MSAKTIRKQLALCKPLLCALSLKTIRRGQNAVGQLMESRHRNSVIVKEHGFEKFPAAWVLPKDERRGGVILYLHGGGYTCGDLEYATGFGSMLAVECGNRVFCPAYRLAPENPFPAALDDALAAYEYLLSKGYSSSHITLCGESAGGGLCYSLCLALKEKGLPLPCAIVAISPWVDLTNSGESYESNREADPSMTREALDFFANSYAKNRKDPFASPILAELADMPQSLIFVGGDEILLSDSARLHAKLLAAGGKSRLVVAKNRWHAYLLYGLAEDKKDLALLNRFLNHAMEKENKLRWLRLDNAAKIYPAARSQEWSNVFRLSATLDEDIDKEVMQSALDVTARRFPSIAVRLRRGIFWYYLEQVSDAPQIREEYSYPLTRMSKTETGKCAFRVIVHGKRVALEIFHSITDGTGAMIFLKSLVAEYIQQKYGEHVPPEHGVLGRLEEPSEAELEDSYQRYAGKVAASRKENTAWHVLGTPEAGDFLNLTCFELSSAEVVKKAHEYKVSVTAFLTAALMMALQNLQEEKIENEKHRPPIKVLIPVNLRNVFESRSLRNFAMYVTPEILPRLGRYTFPEICREVHHCMGREITQKHMGMRIETNVKSERLGIVKIMPLFVKNLVMKAIFTAVGERKSCLTLSNLGAVKLPEIMEEHVKRMDFILGVQASAPYNCGVLSYGDTLYINFIRNIRESELEYHFHCVLRELGLGVTVQSNAKK